MRREPSLTFEGALRILGRHELPGIEKLDKILGGVILAAGVGTGVAAVGPEALTPLKMFAAVWGWLEQKDAAIGLLRGGIAGLSGKLAGTSGRERRELIAAAHTVIVAAAFFETFREHVGKKFYDSLAITEEKKKTLIVQPMNSSRETIYDALYAAEIPAPSAARGFEENISQVNLWLRLFTFRVHDFMIGLAASKDLLGGQLEVVDQLEVDVANKATERYRSHFLALAAKVPEFMVWALLNEGTATRSSTEKLRQELAGHGDALLTDGAATRSMIAGLRADMAAALDVSREALGRLAALLALDAGSDRAMLDQQQSLAWANDGVLQEKIVPGDAQGYTGIEFPTVSGGYVNPRFRLARCGRQFVVSGTTRELLPGEKWFDTIRPADEHWWDERASRIDFDLMLAAYVTSPEATRLPMLLLGHPGAGKSMLTKVFAARLPTSAYTVVRVPLRRVGANAPVRTQIETALADATNGRVDSWWKLAAQSQDTVRVVLLDGLDELLQASQTDRSGYLQEVMEFQQHEAEQRQPVVVVVTSRTVVADRVDIPDGTTVVKLDFFEDPDIADWLDRWHRINAAQISAGTMRALSVESVLGTPPAAPRDAATVVLERPGGDSEEADQDDADWDEIDDGDREQDVAEEDDANPARGGLRELARQPLLLLMLALYAADPALPLLNPDLATADLYQRLLESFCRREAVKAVAPNPSRDPVSGRMQDHLDRLSIAALAMFNRGRQDIGEEELGTDLAALDASLMERSRPVEAGQRIIGEFFFVHAPEARMLARPGQVDVEQTARSPLREPPRRSYEFLHATFGEYLVAQRIMGELVEVAARAFAGRRGPTELVDDLLYALLSHRALAARKSTLTFAKEIFAGLPDRDRERVPAVLEMLLGSYRHRQGSNKYASYQPRSADTVRELSSYSANLVALRVTLEPEEEGTVPLAKLLRCAAGDAMDEWRSMVMLWKSGLDPDCMQAMLATVSFSNEQPAVRAGVMPSGLSGAVGDARIAITNEISLARLINERATERRLIYGAAAVDGYVHPYLGSSWADQMASWLIPAIAGKGIRYLIIDPPPEIPDEDIVFVAGLISTLLVSGKIQYGCIEDLLRLLLNLPPVFPIDVSAIVSVVLPDSQLLRRIPEIAQLPGFQELWDKRRTGWSFDPEG